MDQQNIETNSVTGNEVSRNLQEMESMEKIFTIDLILENIIKFLIFDKDVKASKNMLKTVRLVQKHWLNTTSTLLKNSTEPKITLNCIKPKVNTNKLAETLVETLTSSRRPSILLLPCKLILKTNCEVLIKCLAQLENELMELQVTIIPDNSRRPLVIPKFNLPRLRKTSFEFSFRTFTINPNNTFPIFKYKNGMFVIQQIINGAENLQELIFPTTSDHYKRQESLQIPHSVVYSAVQNQIRAQYMEILLRSKLPNLRHIALKMSKSPYEDEKLFKVLEILQNSLQSLEIDGKHRSPSDKMILKFPKLNNLNQIQVKGSRYEFERGTEFNLKTLLPKVKLVDLTYQTETSLANWTQHGDLAAVETLSLSVLNEAGNVHDFFKSVKSEIMAQVESAFPNIRNLEITVNIKDMSGLMHVFQNMVQLKSLKINLQQSIRREEHLKYESALIGLPLWLTSAHALGSEYVESFICKGRRKPSLLNLTELTSFTLWVSTLSDSFCPRKHVQRMTLQDGFFCSDTLFSQVFFNMPTLRNLTLSENIQPTKEVEAKWKAEGRLLEYIGIKNEKLLEREYSFYCC